MWNTLVMLMKVNYDKYFGFQIEVHPEKYLTLNIENIISNNNIEFISEVGAYEYKFQ